MQLVLHGAAATRQRLPACPAAAPPERQSASTHLAARRSGCSARSGRRGGGPLGGTARARNTARGTAHPLAGLHIVDMVPGDGACTLSRAAQQARAAAAQRRGGAAAARRCLAAGPAASRVADGSLHIAAAARQPARPAGPPLSAAPTCVGPALVCIPRPPPRVILVIPVALVRPVPPRRPPLVAQDRELLLRRHLQLRRRGAGEAAAVLQGGRTGDARHPGQPTGDARHQPRGSRQAPAEVVQARRGQPSRLHAAPAAQRARSAAGPACCTNPPACQPLPTRREQHPPASCAPPAAPRRPMQVLAAPGWRVRAAWQWDHPRAPPPPTRWFC